MPVASVFSPIRVLPPQLADQIAAGEVIERPASVVKELVENSLDAGATRLDIELHQGGMARIRVADNGHGIAADELPLAIFRHATSKISQLDDLYNLYTLGFRGEALASICSVSEWEIHSNRLAESGGQRLSYRDAALPTAVAHTTGTTVTIDNLFYNTPARRKFLRSEQTEYRYCDDVIKRLALSRFDVGFFVQHNQRQVYRLPAVSDALGRNRRVAQLLSESFISQSLQIEFAHQGMRLHGWVSTPAYSRQQADLQYFFINGRIIRDRIITHAVRMAYQATLPPGRYPAYVLYLEIEPRVIDVNVHPTKHEVRFHETRLVHDFLARCLRDSLQRGPAIITAVPAGLPSTYAAAVAEPATAYTNVTTPATLAAGLLAFGRYYLQTVDQQLHITDMHVVRSEALRATYAERQHTPVISRPLLLPKLLEVPNAVVQRCDYATAALQTLGFDLSIAGPQSLLLRAIPTRIPVEYVDSLIMAVLTEELDGRQTTAEMADLLSVRLLRQMRDTVMPVEHPQLAALLQDAKHLGTTREPWQWRITADQFHNWIQQHYLAANVIT
jgi:DNA mismatch repair protein MutL